MHATASLLPPSSSAPFDLRVALHDINESARAGGRTIRHYEVRFTQPVSFELAGRRHHQVSRLRFHAWTFGHCGILVATRANARKLWDLPHPELIGSINAAYVEPVVTNSPPLGRDGVMATLATMEQLSRNAGRPLSGYIVEYSRPQTFRVGKTAYQDITRLRFRSFRIDQGRILVAFRRRHRYRYALPRPDLIVRVLPAKPSAEDRFDSFEAFARRFDRRFVTEAELQSLWISTSGQHGHRYRPSDFRRLGPKGRQAVAQFLKHFVGLDTPGPAHDPTGVLRIAIHSRSEHAGRDISIHHKVGAGFITYASEFPGSGNGSYFLLVSENTVLHLEDD